MSGSYENAPTLIQSILDKLIEKDTTSNISTISSLWLKVVGNQIAEQTKPIATKNSILLVHVSSSTWVQHLGFYKKNIIDKLNNLKKKDFISDIKFKIGSI